MMDNTEELRRSLSDFVKQNKLVQIELGLVLRINEADKLCDVEDLDGNEVLDVRLRADDSEDGFLLFPKVGSWVVFSNLNDADEHCLLGTTQFDKISFSKENISIEIDEEKCFLKNESVEVSLDNQGVKIANGGESLKGLISELVDAIKLITVPVVSVGSPSGVPVNSPLFDTLKVRFNSLLK